MDEFAAMAKERLAWELASWASIEMKVRVQYLVNEAAPSMESAVTEAYHHYIETAGGQRMSEERMVLADGKTTLNIAYTDGERSASLNRFEVQGTDIESVLIQHGFPGEAKFGWYNCPEPLRWFYCGLRPLHEAMAEARHLGISRQIDRDCDMFLISRSSGSDPVQIVFHLDRSTAIPLRVEIFANERDRLEGHAVGIWTAKSLDEIQGRFLPLRSEQVIYAHNAPHHPEVVREIVVEEVGFDRHFPASTFWPKISERTQVIDQITGHATPSRIVTQLGRTKDATTSPPIRALSPIGLMDVLPSASLGLGVAMLTVGAVLWWRRGHPA